MPDDSAEPLRHREPWAAEKGVNDGQTQRKRLDMSTIEAAMNEADTSSTNTNTRTNPAQVAAIYRMLANTYQTILGENNGATRLPNGHFATDITSGGEDAVLEYMIQQSIEHAETSNLLNGVPQSYLDSLDRVDKKELVAKAAQEADSSCPICKIAFLDDKYPLVVRLPCHESHWFDLECVAPWLKTNVHCPLCRAEVYHEHEKKKAPVPQSSSAVTADDEEDYDDMYA